MKISKITATALVTAMLAAGPAFAITEEECTCEEPARGDNGWGNGADTTNAGSFSGGTAPSKSSNGTNRSDAHYPAALEKFDGR
jgi:hypothetical protein